MSIGKHRVGHPSRVSDIHVRLTGAGEICGASSRVMNPISGRAGPFDLSLIRSSISWGDRVATDVGIASPEKMAQVVLPRLRPVGDATETSTYRSAVGGGKPASAMWEAMSTVRSGPRSGIGGQGRIRWTHR